MAGIAKTGRALGGVLLAAGFVGEFCLYDGKLCFLLCLFVIIFKSLCIVCTLFGYL